MGSQKILYLLLNLNDIGICRLLHIAELIFSHRFYDTINIVPKFLVIDAVHLGNTALDQALTMCQTDIGRLGVEPFLIVGAIRAFDLPDLRNSICGIIRINTCHFSVNCAEIDANIFIPESKTIL